MKTNNSWYKKPKVIKTIPLNKTILFIDESGVSSLKSFQNSVASGSKGKSIRDDVFLLNGIIIDGVSHKILTSRFNKIKKKLYKNGEYDYPKKGVRPINFHNVEIEGRKRPFDSVYDNFYSDLNTAIEKTNFIQISSGLNYYVYGLENKCDPLLIELGIIVTKFAEYLKKEKKEGIIVFESDNEDTDTKKLEYLKRLMKKGTRKNKPELYSNINAVYFRPKWLIDNETYKTCAGLELADLTISPVRRLYHPEFITIEKKLYGYPNYGRNSINIIK